MSTRAPPTLCQLFSIMCNIYILHSNATHMLMFRRTSILKGDLWGDIYGVLSLRLHCHFLIYELGWRQACSRLIHMWVEFIIAYRYFFIVRVGNISVLESLSISCVIFWLYPYSCNAIICAIKLRLFSILLTLWLTCLVALSAHNACTAPIPLLKYLFSAAEIFYSIAIRNACPRRCSSNP